MSSHPIYALGETLVSEIAHHRPAAATMWGLPGHDHRWEDLSPEGHAAYRDTLLSGLRRTDALPPAKDRWEKLAIYLLRDHLEEERDAIDRGDHLVNLNHVSSPFQLFNHTLSHMDTTTASGQEAIVGRLEGLGDALSAYRRSLQRGLDTGHLVAERQIRSVVDQGHALAKARAFHRWPALVGTERGERAADSAHAAYAELTDWLASRYLPRAAPEDGVGRDRYPAAVKRFLCTSIDLDETLAWGWDEVAHLSSQLQRLLASVAPGLSLASAVERWRHDPATTAPCPEVFLTRVRAWQEAALERLDAVLPIPDAVRTLKIEQAPQGFPPGAWYTPPSEDFRRPGTVQYSLREGPIPLFDQQSTAYHEGIPGHHLQLGVQRTLTGLSRFQRTVYGCSGFAEGWALYAEALMDELGCYEDPVQRVGYLVNQIARACRVVFDIGAHTGQTIPTTSAFEPGQPWTFARGVAFMTEVGGLRPEIAASEVTRYLGWPGQAVSYKVGQKVLLDVRRDFLAAGGTLPTFHERLLGSGTVGLDLARAQVFQTFVP